MHYDEGLCFNPSAIFQHSISSFLFCPTVIYFFDALVFVYHRIVCDSLNLIFYLK